MRPWIMFTKHLEGWDLGQMIDGLKKAGVEGADLAVRPGYPVHPENATAELPKAAKRFADEGLSIPLVTTPGDFTEPTIDYAESLFDACAEAGVKLIKLGYWYPEEDGYWASVDRCKKRLEGFSKLAERTGVKPIVHNHSGRYMALNSSAAMHIMEGFDPKLVGVFADVGHLSIVGEPYEMAFDIVREYLAAVAFKDLVRQLNMRDGKAEWRTVVWPLGMGFADFPVIMRELKKVGFDGPISFHAEYSGKPPESVVDQCRIDTRYIQSILDDMG